MNRLYSLLAVTGCVAFSGLAHAAGVTAKQAEVMKQLLATYEAAAKEDGKGKKAKSNQFTPFTAEDGRKFYLMRRTWQSSDPTCSGCHTEDPTKEGKHIDTKKSIKPLAPSANPERFTDIEKIEKNFSEHCVDLLGRNCEAREKGNYIAYMMSIK